jgi:cytochrome c-type biogenesis protein
MINALTNLGIAFLAGFFAPLGAVCVLPLYPGFLSYLANKVSTKDSQKQIIYLGLVVTFGVILSMFIVGLLFTAIFSASLTNAISIISPIAFGILGIISILLIFNIDIGRFFPKAHAPVLKNPYLSALIFGLFFGAIVLPCNPAALVVLFALSTSVSSFIINLLNFIFFGFGMALPLLILAIISGAASKQVIGFLTTYKRSINIIAGLIMLVISIYYLVFVFKIFG